MTGPCRPLMSIHAWGRKSVRPPFPVVTELVPALIVLSSSTTHSEVMSAEVVPVGEATGVRDADQTRHDRRSVMIFSVSSVETGQGEYAHLVALQRRYAKLTSDEPQRQRLREQLISGYLPVVEHIARRFAGRGEPLDDLVQVATGDLIKAVDRFEPHRSSDFFALVVPTIIGELRRYFRDHGWSMRVSPLLKDLPIAIRSSQTKLSQQLGRAPRPSGIAEKLGLPVSEVIDGLQAGDAYPSASQEEMLGGHGTAILGEFIGDLDNELTLIEEREVLRPLLAKLAPRQRTILTLRFFRQLTQTQIAEQVGISQMQVSRVLSQTLALLRERMDPSC
jgi:RNA polymerase sigma-B factor